MKNKNLFLYFVGDIKNQSYSVRVQNKINNLNLNDKCKIMGNFSKDDLINSGLDAIASRIINASK